jgi:NADP-dependent 3-hydroxy acid dehydrogenase YdfG
MNTWSEVCASSAATPLEDKGANNRKETNMADIEQDPLRFAGKVALVAGASRGIGAATAQAFARAGASVVLAARDQSALDSVVATIRATGGRAHAVVTDVGTPRPSSNS